jgi:molybdate transport system substrate-binding protein
MGRLRPELSAGLRSHPYGSYMIYFRYVGDVLEVVNILEGHKDVLHFLVAIGVEAAKGRAMRSRAVASAGAVSLFLFLLIEAAGAAELKVMYPPPLRTVLSELIPQFEGVTGHKLAVTFESSWLLVGRIQKGESPDVAFLTVRQADDLIAEGKLARRVDVARSSIGIAVRTGAPKPDLGSIDAVKRTLLAAKSFARNEGADSGVFMAGLLERLGIAAEMKAKSTLVRQGYVAELVAKGEVEMAAQQMPELMTVAGVDATPLPPEIQHAIVFSAVIPAAPNAPDAVDALLKFLATPAAGAVIKAKGLEPM